MDKNIYINDLIHRYPSHTFTETSVGSETKVEFKNASSVLIRRKQKLNAIDAYRLIRQDLLSGEAPQFLSTTVQRDALTGVDKGTLVLNVTTGRIEEYDGSAWASSAGAGTMAASSYGNMYEDSVLGSAMNPTTKEWITANSGVYDANDMITFLNHANGDRLVIGTGGAGDYMVVASCGQTNSGSNKTTMTVRVNGTDSTVVKDDQNASSTNHRALVANGIITLADSDYLSLHLVDPDTPANIIKVFDCHLTIQRIS